MDKFPFRIACVAILLCLVDSTAFMFFTHQSDSILASGDENQIRSPDDGFESEEPPSVEEVQELINIAIQSQWIKFLKSNDKICMFLERELQQTQ
jgi:hypothetical protein